MLKHLYWMRHNDHININFYNYHRHYFDVNFHYQHIAPLCKQTQYFPFGTVSDHFSRGFVFQLGRSMSKYVQCLRHDDDFDLHVDIHVNVDIHNNEYIQQHIDFNFHNEY